MSNFTNIGRKLATNVFKALNFKANVTLLQSPLALSSQKRFFLEFSETKKF